MKKNIDRAIGLFKPWIVKRPDGGCQVLFPLSELDELVKKIIEIVERPDKLGVAGNQ